MFKLILMKKFLCTFYLSSNLDHGFWEIISQHRIYINSLMRDEVIVTYSVNDTRTKGWVVLNAETEAAAEEYVEKFPIRSYFHYELDELFIFDSMIGAPKLVMN
jgi:hypothetical protein